MTAGIHYPLSQTDSQIANYLNMKGIMHTVFNIFLFEVDMTND